MIFAADGSGGSDIAAGYGVVAYNETTKQQQEYYGAITTGNATAISLNSTYDKLRITYGSENVKPTNNRGELCAIHLAVLLAKQQSSQHVDMHGLMTTTIVTDSKYCIGVFTEWYSNWCRDGIKHKKKNIDLIDKIAADMQGMSITFVHQKAHLAKSAIDRMSGQAKLYALLNNRADQLAELGKNN